jgi:hypothetical protein
MATSDDDAAVRAHYEELIADHTKRLRALQRKAAQQGNNTPAEIDVEIADIQRKITELKARIEPAVDQIKHPFVRGFLERAATAYTAQQYQEAATQALGGLLWALRMVRPAVLGRDPTPTLGQIYGLEPRPPQKRDEEADLRNLFQALRLDYGGYLRLRSQIGDIKLMGSTDLWLQRFGALPEIDVVVANQALRFAIAMILEIEAQAGDLRRPFGLPGISLPKE